MFFNLSLAIWSEIHAYEMMGNAILKRLKWTTKGHKNENLSQHARKRLCPLWRHMMWTALRLALFLLSWWSFYPRFFIFFLIWSFKMSDSETSDTTSNRSSSGECSDSEDYRVVCRPLQPYRFEPSAPENSEDVPDEDEDKDEDGLTPNTLEQRMDNRIPLDTW